MDKPKRGGWRPRQPGALKTGPKPIPVEQRKKKVSITLDPTNLLLVQWHAKARGNSLSESVNTLLGEALRNHTIDTDAQEVL